MSSLYYKSYDTNIVRSAIHSVVFNKQMDFADYIRTKVAESGLSYRDIADKANKKEQLLSHSTIGDIISRRNLNPSSKTIRGLSIGLGITESEIISKLKGKKSDVSKVASEKFELLSMKFNDLKGAKKIKAEVLIDVLDRELDRLANEK